MRRSRRRGKSFQSTVCHLLSWCFDKVAVAENINIGHFLLITCDHDFGWFVKNSTSSWSKKTRDAAVVPFLGHPNFCTSKHVKWNPRVSANGFPRMDFRGWIQEKRGASERYSANQGLRNLKLSTYPIVSFNYNYEPCYCSPYRRPSELYSWWIPYHCERWDPLLQEANSGSARLFAGNGDRAEPCLCEMQLQLL